MKLLPKAPAVLLLISGGLILVGVIGIRSFSYFTRPTFEVHNVSQTTWERCDFRWLDEIHTITTFGPGEEHLFRVSSEASMDIICIADGGQANVRGEVGYFTTGGNFRYIITIGDQKIETALIPLPKAEFSVKDYGD